MDSYCKVKKKRRRRRVLLIVFAALTAVIAGAAVFIVHNVNPMIISISNERIRALTSVAVSGAVLDVMSDNKDIEFMTIERDADGKIKSVDIDASEVSDLAQKITIEAQRRINESGQDGIKIPLGSLSGVTLFTGIGPDINIKIYLVGSTQTRITSEFTDTGINQTVHRLYLNISGSVAVAIPGLPSTVTTSAQVLMSELIIVGDIPTTYLHASTIGDMLDLLVD